MRTPDSPAPTELPHSAAAKTWFLVAGSGEWASGKWVMAMHENLFNEQRGSADDGIALALIPK